MLCLQWVYEIVAYRGSEIALPLVSYTEQQNEFRINLVQCVSPKFIFGVCQHNVRSVSFVVPRARKLSWDLPADEGFLCSKTAKFVDTMKEIPCTSPWTSRFLHPVCIKVVILYPED